MKINNSEEEIREQESQIKSKLLLIFIPIGIMVAGIIIYQNNSSDYNSKKYSDFQNVYFSGKVTSKREEGNCFRCTKFITLDNKREEFVDFDVYSKIQIGDFVQKSKNHDSVYYHLKNGEVLIIDKGKFIRESYKRAMNKK